MTSLAQTLFQFAEIMDEIESNDGVIDERLLPVLSKQESLVADKVDSYVDFIEVVQSQIEQKKKLIEKTRVLIKQLDNLEYRLKENAKNLMQLHEIKELNGNNRKIKLVNSGGKEAIQYKEDFFVIEKGINKKYISEIPSDLYDKHEVYVLKVDKFREFLEEQTLECAHIVPRGKYIKIV